MHRVQVRNRRLCRDPDLVVLWRGAELVVRNVRIARSVCASPGAIELLSAFDRPRNVAAIIGAYPPDDRETLSQAIRDMERLGLLVPDGNGNPGGRLAAWNGNVASALYHGAVRDLQYLVDPTEARGYMRDRQAAAGPPPPFKRYPHRRAISLRVPDPARKTADLSRVLEARRTTRDFSRRAALFASLAAIVRGTWGQTGWLDGGDLGRAPTRTSPSGGALHPIECYVVAMRVDGLESGLYHYDVRGNELRRLKAGDFKRETIRFASGQRWVGGAAFLCIMTAAFERTMWKYRRENAYRTVWIEAGHFAQTFSLLAISYGLGPFTTAAMQDSRIERFIGLDGVREFPVYLCGAGMPGPRRISPRWTPIRDGRPITASVPVPRSRSRPRRAAS